MSLVYIVEYDAAMETLRQHSLVGEGMVSDVDINLDIDVRI